MIAFLTGQIQFKSPEYTIIDVQGVGYQVVLPLSSFYELPPLKEEVQLHIYTHVREDVLSLFGFLTILEKKLFLLLLEVTGIGAKLALNILSGISAQELFQALMMADSQRIQRVPGVGKKTSERIILELKDRVKKIDQALPPPPEKGGWDRTWEDALSALLNLGYGRSLAEKALETIRLNAEPEMTLEELLRRSLRSLSQ
jgi:holliday junction DNA helicase RuvA